MIAACERPTTPAAAAIAARLRAGIPTLQTARLVLRAPRLQDFDAYADILCSERSAPFGGPFDRAGAWADFTNYVAGWLLHGHGVWTLADPASPEAPLGFLLIGLEPGDAEPELGYMLTAEAEGRGLATEAARAALAFAVEKLGFATLVSYVDAGNPRSVAVTARLGAARDPAAEAVLDHAVRVFRYPLPEPRP